MNASPVIVILEDDRSTRSLLRLYMERAGYSVYDTGEGRYAVELVMKLRPALLIADVMMPGMNGSDVVKQLLTTDFGRSMNILFLTSLLGKNVSNDKETSLTVEGIRFPALSKPVNGPLLLNAVDRLVTQAEAPEETTA